MNTQELRQSLKQKWLLYYQQNCHWLEKMQIWAVFDGERRPLSSFVLATVSVLEPNLVDILPLLVDLNANPDDMIAALGLNFDPRQELNKVDNDYNSIQHPENQPEQIIHITPSNNLQYQTAPGVNEIKSLQSVAVMTRKPIREVSVSSVAVVPRISTEYKLTPEIQKKVNELSTVNRRKLANWIDEFCQGRDWDKDESSLIPF
jgi:Family of unknown function (DUF5331)